MSGKELADRYASKHAAKKSGAAGRKYRTAKAGAVAADPVQWSDVDSDTLHRTIDAVVRAGDAITFSRTSDGGAYSVTVLSDGARIFHRAPTTEEIEQELAQIREDAEMFVRHTS